jgi:hypothetical protein
MTDIVLQNAGVGIGVFLGVFITLALRKRAGNGQGLVGGSALATALVAAFFAMAVLTVVRGIMVSFGA